MTTALSSKVYAAGSPDASTAAAFESLFSRYWMMCSGSDETSSCRKAAESTEGMDSVADVEDDDRSEESFSLLPTTLEYVAA